MAKFKKQKRESIKDIPMAEKAGPAAWAIPTPACEQDDGDLNRQKKLEIELGQQLIDISKWVGLRAGVNDQQSIKLLLDHLAIVFETGKEIILKNAAAKN